MFRSIVCVFIALATLMALGCGTKGKGLKVEFVTGKVTLDNEPIAEASVIFVPKTDTPPMETASGITDANGVYKLTSGNGDPQAGAVEGEYTVLVSKILAKSLREGQDYAASTGYNVPYTQTHLLPAKYRDNKATPLSATVKRGKNTLNFELTKE